MASHSEVAHRWAQQVYGEEVRPIQGFRMFFEGPTIFSHGRHFAIAKIVKTTPKKADAADVPARVVLLNSNSYSISTGHHQSEVRSAIPGHVQTFSVSNPQCADHAATLKEYEKTAATMFEKSQRARLHKEWPLKAAHDALEEAALYAKAFGVKWSKPDVAVISAKLAKEAAATAKKEAAARKIAAKVQAERAAAQRIEDAEAFRRWQTGAHPGARVPYSYNRTLTGGAYLRRYGDELQTSQGAAVPWEHAVKVFRFVKLVRERGAGWQSNGHSVRVGHYRLDSVSPSGDFVAGCHRIEWGEIEALAKAQGVFDLAASDSAVTVTEGAH